MESLAVIEEKVNAFNEEVKEITLKVAEYQVEEDLLQEQLNKLQEQKVDYGKAGDLKKFKEIGQKEAEIEKQIDELNVFKILIQNNIEGKRKDLAQELKAIFIEVRVETLKKCDEVVDSAKAMVEKAVDASHIIYDIEKEYTNVLVGCSHILSDDDRMHARLHLSSAENELYHSTKDIWQRIREGR
jgi:DNA polymerase III delta prime subunit